jgi:anti-sigma-K factor RskA
MSEGPELPEDEAFAAEHALGVLSAPERARAELRMAREPAFAAEVEAWRDRLAPMIGDVAEVEPPSHLWPRIEAGLAANDTAGPRLAFWRRAAWGGFSLAAASLVAAVMIANERPAVVAAPPAPAGRLLNARIDTPKGQHLFVAAYDPNRQAILISSLVPAGTDPGHVHELWLIPADGKPRAVGFVPVGGSLAIPVAAPLAGLADEKAALAVSVEAPGGSKKDGPTGPVVAVGKLATI